MPLYNGSSSVIISSSAAATTVASTTASTIILAANSARKGGTILNAGSGNLFIDFEETASLAVYLVKIAAGAYYEIPFNYTGVVSGIWDAASGNALVRELT